MIHMYYNKEKVLEMNKNIIKLSLILLISITLLTGCSSKKGNKIEDARENISYEGLEFVNVGFENSIIKTTIINNMDRPLGKTKFSMKIMDKEGNIIVILDDEITSKIEIGTTLTIETKTNKDLSNATSIEYSIFK